MMTDITWLWLPILLATAGTFVASFVLWAATPWHKPDVRAVPDAGAADAALESLNLAPGHYMVPCTHDCDEMKSAAFKERYKRGPWATINVMPAPPSMGKNMALTFGVFLIVSLLVAYLGASTLAPGTGYLKVFQVCGTAAFLAYTFGGLANAIWFGKQAGWILRDVIDALIYTGITAGLFAWLWPAAIAATGGVIPGA